MATVSVPSAEVLLSKRVQEMVITGDDPVGPFLCRNGHDLAQRASTDNSPIPIVDMGCFFAGKWSAEETEQELHKLKCALSTWGCFQAIGHGITSSFLDKVQRVGREFFEQPIEEKNKYAKTLEEFQGYGADPTPEEGQSLDWSDRLLIALVPKDQRDYRFWPQNPTCFKETVNEWTEKMKRVAEMISKSMARSLHLEEDCFLKQFGEGAQLHGRFNFYPPCKGADLVLGLKAHADGSGYTLLLQDEEGLEVLKDGKWYTVPKNPDAILVLMGDQMEIMSNGAFTSPVHRVIPNGERDRVSVALFYTPEVGKDIGPEEGLISEEAPRLFKNVKDYADIHMVYYKKGMRALHTAQL
ncbi:hypothetical protein ACS0TY_030321 [Phlomoides rotata]